MTTKFFMFNCRNELSLSQSVATTEKPNNSTSRNGICMLNDLRFSLSISVLAGHWRLVTLLCPFLPFLASLCLTDFVKLCGWHFVSFAFQFHWVFSIFRFCFGCSPQIPITLTALQLFLSFAPFRPLALICAAD